MQRLLLCPPPSFRLKEFQRPKPSHRGNGLPSLSSSEQHLGGFFLPPRGEATFLSSSFPLDCSFVFFAPRASTSAKLLIPAEENIIRGLLLFLLLLPSNKYYTAVHEKHLTGYMAKQPVQLTHSRSEARKIVAPLASLPSPPPSSPSSLLQYCSSPRTPLYSKKR